MTSYEVLMSLELLLPVESKNNEQPFRPLAGGVQTNLQSETIFSKRTEHHEERNWQIDY